MTLDTTGRDGAAPSRPAASPPRDPGGPDHRVWDLFHCVVLIVTGTLVLASGSGAVGQRLAAVGALLALAVGYVLVGRPLAVAHAERLRPGLWYLLGCAVLLLLAIALSEPATWALASLSLQAYLVVPWGPAVAVVTVLSLLPLPADALGWRPSTVSTGSVLWTALAVVAGSALFTRWVDQLARQNTERAELIAALRASRGEVAALSREAGVLAERGRLSAEIHDTLAQGFTSVLRLVEAAGRTSDPERARRHLELAATACRENLAEARAMVAALAPAPLTEHGLAGSLHRVAERVQAETGVAVTVTVDPDLPELARPVEVALVRATQEGLTNVVRHAGADRATVQLSRRDGEVVLVVEDDGVGPGAPAGQRDGHFGLAGMAHRLAALGGAVQLGPGRDGRGARLEVVLPVARQGATP